MAEFKDISDRDLMERIYTSQLRIMMDVEKIWENVIALRKKVDPDALDPIKNENFNDETGIGFRHLYEIHHTFNDSYDEFKDQLRENL